MKKSVLVFIVLIAAIPSFGQWIPQTPDTSSSLISYYEISFIDNNLGFVTGDAIFDYHNYNTADGGLNWTDKGWGHRLINFLDSNTGWACSYLPPDRNIFKTENGGINWNSQLDSALYDFPTKIVALDSLHVWVLGGSISFGGPSYNYVYRTVNGGAAWDLVNIMEFSLANDIVFTDSLNGWMVGVFYPDSVNSFQVVRTHDGGKTWSGQLDVTAIPGSENDRIGSVCFTDSLNGWIAGGLAPYTIDTGGTIYHTVDGGLSWQKQTDGTIPSLNCILFVDNNKGWAAGKHGTILHTTDGGVNWSYQISNTTHGLNDISFTDSTHGWICGDSSVVLHTVNGGISGVEYEAAEKDGFAVFPNPVDREATIDIMLKQPQKVTIRLVDITGRVKTTIPCGQKQAGRFRAALNAENLPAGLYFITVITEKGIMSDKLIVY